jgi:hypothetical protein
MKFSEALAAIGKLENGSELVSAIEGELEGLKTKNFEVIGEKRNATTKAQTLETTVLAIAKTLGITGDLDTVLSSIESKAQSVASESTQLKADKTALETRATQAEGKLQGFERKSKLADIATAAGANAAVLERLLGDKLDELKIEGEGADRVVKLGDKALKEAIAADDVLKQFEAALFPAQSSNTTAKETKTPPKLPSGNPNGSPKDGERASRSYLNSTYGKTADFLMGKTAGN